MIEENAKMVDAEYQKKQIRRSIEQGWKEVQGAMETERPLQLADELLHELKQ